MTAVPRLRPQDPDRRVQHQGESVADLNERFPATPELFAGIRDSDTEYAETIVRFWA